MEMTPPAHPACTVQFELPPVPLCPGTVPSEATTKVPSVTSPVGQATAANVEAKKGSSSVAVTVPEYPGSATQPAGTDPRGRAGETSVAAEPFGQPTAAKVLMKYGHVVEAITPPE